MEILIASFPGLTQLFITCHAASDESRVGPGNEVRNLKLLILIYFVAFLKQYTVPTKKACHTQQSLFSWDQGEEDWTRRGSKKGSGWNHTTEREDILPTVSCSHQWSVQSRQCQRKHWSSYLGISGSLTMRQEIDFPFSYHMDYCLRKLSRFSSSHVLVHVAIES